MTKSSKKVARRAARALILQILYEIDVTPHKLGETLNYHLAEADFTEAQERFVRKMVYGTLRQQAELDQYIEEVASEWPLEQMAPVDRNILRMGLYELRYQPKRAREIVINEAIELARTFGPDSSPRFVNGVLGTFVTRYV